MTREKKMATWLGKSMAANHSDDRLKALVHPILDVELQGIRQPAVDFRNRCGA